MAKQITKENVFVEIGNQLRKVEVYARSYNQEIQNSCGITSPQLGILSVIAQNRRTTLTDLSKYLGLHITTADGFIESLYKKKLIKKIRRRSDKRSVDIYINDKGQKLLEESPMVGLRKLQHSLKNISDEEAQCIYDALVRLVALYGASDIEV